MVAITRRKAMEHDRLRQRDKEMVPRLLLRAMFGMVLVSLAIVAYARLTDRPLVATPPDNVEIVAERSIILHGTMGGAALVRSPDGSVIADFPGDEGGFVAGIWRVIQRERMLHKVEPDLPVQLILWADSRLSIRDEYTGWRAELIGFGIDNYRIFLGLLDLPEHDRTAVVREGGG